MLFCGGVGWCMSGILWLVHLWPLILSLVCFEAVDCFEVQQYKGTYII